MRGGTTLWSASDGDSGVQCDMPVGCWIVRLLDRSADERLILCGVICPMLCASRVLCGAALLMGRCPPSSGRRGFLERVSFWAMHDLLGLWGSA